MVTSRRPPRAASVKTQSLPRTVSADEEALMSNGGSIQSSQRYSEEDTLGDAVITHTRPGRVLMWKPLENGTYVPRTVSESAKEQNYKNGWKFKCPECNTNHEASPYPPGDPNSCPAREPLAFRVCPVCGKRVLDNMITSNFIADDSAPDADMAIKDDMEASTPESRTRVQLDRHLWQFHPRSAEMMGRPPLPVAARQYDGAARPI